MTVQEQSGSKGAKIELQEKVRELILSISQLCHVMRLFASSDKVETLLPESFMQDLNVFYHSLFT